MKTTITTAGSKAAEAAPDQRDKHKGQVRRAMSIGDCEKRRSFPACPEGITLPGGRVAK